MKKILALALATVMALSLVACGAKEEPAPAPAPEAGTSEPAPAPAPEKEKLSIGATFYSLQNEFTMRMDNAGKKWAEANGVDYVGYDGNYDAATQLSQVETMISNGVDAIILNPDRKSVV